MEVLKMPINRDEITKEMIEKAMQCQTVDELMALAKAEGVEITKEEADAYMAELTDYELDSGEIKKIAGGVCTIKATEDASGENCSNYYFYG